MDKPTTRPDSPPAKRARKGKHDKKSTEINKPSLLDLSDDVLLHVLSSLGCSVDLLRVSETCSRLRRICADHSLWTRLETLHAAQPVTRKDLGKLVRCVNAKTTIVSIKGFVGSRNKSPSTESVTPSMLREITTRATRLEELVLQNCFIDASKIEITMLPPTLKVLRFDRCEVFNIKDRQSYFKDLHVTVPNLEILELSHCGWMSTHSLMAICKCEQLQELSLLGCHRIGECFAYVALSTRFGFRKLVKADLRDTNVSDMDVGCFGRLLEIRTLYLGRTSKDTAVEMPAQSEGNGIITDRGIVTFCPANGEAFTSKLSHLHIAHTEITDEVLPKLAGALPLDFLDVRFTKVTEKGKAAVTALRPNCIVLI